MEHLADNAQTGLLIPNVDCWDRDLSAANDGAPAWCSEVNARGASEFVAFPADRLVRK